MVKAKSGLNIHEIRNYGAGQSSRCKSPPSGGALGAITHHKREGDLWGGLKVKLTNSAWVSIYNLFLISFEQESGSANASANVPCPT